MKSTKRCGRTQSHGGILSLPVFGEGKGLRDSGGTKPIFANGIESGAWRGHPHGDALPGWRNKASATPGAGF
jgi:hypothetical protein